MAQEAAPFAVNLSFSEEVQADFPKDGRMYLFFSTNPRAEPRTQTWPNPYYPTYIFAINMTDVDPAAGMKLSAEQEWISTVQWDLDAVPYGEYTVQVLWDHDTQESRIDAPGNLFCEKQKVTINGDTQLDLTINEVIPEREVVFHELVREITFQSDTLTQFWGRPMYLKAAVMLPTGFDPTANKAYPIRYNIAGYGGRYTRINRMSQSPNFMTWWSGEDAPRVIQVFLDGEGPFGDSYQMDSDNSGAYGWALINELMPHIESQFRGTHEAKTRFVDGCSTGGWVSLGLQLYYPDVFNGVFSYSPDAIEFENYQLINIYQDENAYYNEAGYLRPVMRDVNGEPMLSLKDFIQYENVLGAANSYVNSGGQFSAHNALYSPKGENGLPKPIFDPTTGEIDHEVAETWKKYDFKLYAQANWEELGPKLKDKIYVWMGDMDNFYLNPATRQFARFLEQTENPKSNAIVEFSPMEGHCSKFSDMVVLKQIQERLAALEE